jgi:hypothetical protein
MLSLKQEIIDPVRKGIVFLSEGAKDCVLSTEIRSLALTAFAMAIGFV